MTIPEKSRTIDNLGYKASQDYAINQDRYDKNLNEDALHIPSKTQITTTKTYAPSEYAPLFTMAPKKPWASFAPPPNEDLSTLFTFQLIPSLISEDSLDPFGPLEEKLETIPESPEKKQISDFFACIKQLSQDFSYICGQRNRIKQG